MDPAVDNLPQFFSQHRIIRVDYRRAEAEAQQLASILIDRFGSREIRDHAFAAIPRGGLFPLGMLAYALNLPARALRREPQPGRPLVVVDDCAYTGLRFHQQLQQTRTDSVVFAQLFSTPELRTAIVAAEPRVTDCVAACDLRDLTASRTGDDARGVWRDKWTDRLTGHRYWVGVCELVLFPWSEPDIPWFRGGRLRALPWRFASPDVCLKNRAELALAPRRTTIEYRIPDHVAFSAGEVEVQLCDGESIYSLTGVGAQIWRALAAYGERRLVIAHINAGYDADVETIGADVDEFIERLLEQGLLEPAYI